MDNTREPVSPSTITFWKANHQVIEQLAERFGGEVDPAPWYNPAPYFFNAGSDQDPETYGPVAKAIERAHLSLTRALLTGELRARFNDDGEICDVPGWAWADASAAIFARSQGRLPLDIKLPENWRRWSMQTIELDERAFNDWLLCDSAVRIGSLPDLPTAFDAHERPLPVNYHLPPNQRFITLSQTLSWIAFGNSLDSDNLDFALRNGWLGEEPRALIQLRKAMARLAVQAKGGDIIARGKYIESPDTDPNRALTVAIEPISFEDFARFDLLFDGIGHGSGLTWTGGEIFLERTLPTGRSDSYRYVSVCRADVMRLFPLATTQAASSASAGETERNGQRINRRDWTISDAILWHFYRTEDRVNDPTLRVPSLAAALLYPDIDNGHLWISSALAILDSLKSGVLLATRVSADGIEAPVAAGFWNDVGAAQLADEAFANVFIPAVSVKCAYRVTAQSGDSKAFPTGDPGRPTKGRQIYLAEFVQRRATGILQSTLAAEARSLRAWFVEEHPLADPPGLVSIENSIRAEFKASKIPNNIPS